jgi:hydrogenase/urease accessory protein HupE
MSIARPGSLLLLLLVLAFPLHAHPVAQGAMDIVIHRDHLDLHAQVANEEAFVEQSFSRTPAASALSELWARHGAYLLSHLQVTADGALLRGALVRVSPPANPTPDGRTGYDYRFTYAPDRPNPRDIEVREDVLNEFEFAPGNPWEATYVVRISQEQQPPQEALLLTRKEPLLFACDWNAAPAANVAPTLDQRALFGAYLRHGIMHILAGYDHLLFMSALVLAVVSFADLIKVVTAFTLAHTITLTLSVLNIVRLPSRLVEPMIAASIVIVALQNVFWPRTSRGWSRLLIAFGFGLFHGLGFAGGLLGAMSGLPGLAVATAITAFSLGVELGHQAVVLPIFGGLALGRRLVPPRDGRDPTRIYALRFGSSAVCLAGTFYLVEALK